MLILYLIIEFCFSDHQLWNVVDDLIGSALKSSTKRSYNSAQKQFIEFCFNNELRYLPTTEAAVLLFIGHLHIRGLKGHTIRVYLSAVRSMHVLNGFKNPIDTPRIAAAVKGAIVKSSGPERKHPITFDILGEMIDGLAGRDDASMFKAAFALCFFGCFRSGELCVGDHAIFDPKVHLCVEDITFYDEEKYLSVFLKSSKTDTFSQGIKVFVGCSGHRHCAFCYLKKYMAKHCMSKPGASPLFHHHGGVALKRSYFVSITKILVASLGLDPKNYAGHSFRAGSTTTASQKSFADWELKLLGRWQSNIYSIYVRKPAITASFASRIVK